MNRWSPVGARGETGAVAILVAVFLVGLMLLTAFAVDFGLAYNNKRDLQNSSDAAALGAAATYVGDSALNCASDGSYTLTSEAETVADDLRDDNNPISSRLAMSVRCEGGSLRVTYASQGTTPAILGGVAGESDYTTDRLAEASLVVASSTSGLRPYAICSDDLPASIPTAGFMMIRYPGHPATGSECPAPSGGWLTLQCPWDKVEPDYPDEGNGQPALIAATRDGCSLPVGQVLSQPSDPADRALHLIAACSGASDDEDCLGVQTGAIGNNALWEAWESLLGKSIALPVICGEPPCDPAVELGSGDTALHPVHRIVGAKVCGYHWGKGGKKNGSYIGGACAGADASPGGSTSKDGYLLLAFEYILAEGDTIPTGCTIGDDTCDGLRGVLLTE